MEIIILIISTCTTAKSITSGNAIECDSLAVYSNISPYTLSMTESLKPFSWSCDFANLRMQEKSNGFMETFLCFLLKS